MTRPLLAAATTAVVALGLAGCSSRPVTPDEARMPDPEVTADSHHAAGRFHERAVINDTQGKPAASQIADARRKAREQYEKALELDDAHAPSLFRLAAMSTEDRDAQAAADYWKRYIDATGDAAEGWRNLAVSHDLLGEPREAELAYRQCLSRDPSDATARVNLGMLLARSGRLAEARSELARVLPPAEVHYHVARALRRRGEPEAAAREMRAAAQIDPRYAALDSAAAE